MLQKLAVDHFKVFRRASVELGQISVFIGPNRTGKSTLLQALALLKQSARAGSLQLSGPLVDLGTIADVAHMHEPSHGMEISLELAYKTLVEDHTDAQATYRVTLNEAGFAGHSLVIDKPIRLRGHWDSRTGGVVEPNQFPLGKSMIQLSSNQQFGRPLDFGGWSGETPSQEVERAWRELLIPVVNVLEKTFIVPAIRGIENSAYPLQAASTNDFLSTQGPAAQASAMLSTLAYRRELETAISAITTRILAAEIESRLAPGPMVSAFARDIISTNLVNEGFGLNQLTMMVAQCVVAPAGAVLGIEEPEIHLHPAAQARLCDVFVGWALEEDKQLILTTHSEHILLGLLTQVATGRLGPSELRVYYFERSDQGVAQPQPLEVNERGQLKGGLRGFFESNISELDRYLKASSAGESE